MTWQPIETAPYDVRILATDGEKVSGTYWLCGSWRDESEVVTDYGMGIHDSWSPTSWMPLPDLSE